MRAKPAKPSPPPDFPSAVEARVKFASIGLLVQLHAEILRAAHAHRGRAPGADYEPLVRDVAAAGRDAGRYLRGQFYRFLLVREAARAARLTASQTSQVVGWRVPAATATPAAFVTASWDKAEEMMDGMAECMAGKLGEWLAGGFPPEALDASLQECLDKHSSKWFAWLTLIIGWLAGNIVTETYRAAGVLEAEWVDRGDERVRPAHRALHGTVFRYDEAPPLTADKSSNGEACFPGDDFNCRCTARIVSLKAQAYSANTATLADPPLPL